MARIACLLDVPGLEGLRAAVEQLDIEIRLFGGAARRLALRILRHQPPASPLGLFELAPFAADLDLVHSGGPWQTSELRKIIADAVPWAEAMRWQIRPGLAEAEQIDATNPRIPAARIALSSDEAVGWVDPLNGRRDLGDGRFRYERNPDYSLSWLRQTGRDLEFFSVLLFARIIVESGDEARPTRDATEAARQVVREAASETALKALRTHPILRYRLLNLVRALVAAGGARWMTDPDEELGLAQLISFLDRQVAELDLAEEVAGDSTVAMSALLVETGVPRVDTSFEPWLVGAAAERALAEHLTLLPRLQGEPAPRIADGHQLLLFSPDLCWHVGTAPSELGHEFVHLSIPARSVSDALQAAALDPAVLEVGDLSAAVLIEKMDGTWSVSIPPAASWHGTRIAEAAERNLLVRLPVGAAFERHQGAVDATLAEAGRFCVAVLRRQPA